MTMLDSDEAETFWAENEAFVSGISDENIHLENRNLQCENLKLRLKTCILDVRPKSKGASAEITIRDSFVMESKPLKIDEIHVTLQHRDY